MLQMNDAAVLALRKSFEEVANLSYRLREWLDLETHLRLVEISFRPFNDKMQSIDKNTFGTEASTLNDLWTNCRYPDLMDLSTFTQHIQYINQPVIAGAVSYPDPQGGIAALVQAADGIEQALANGNLTDLKNECEKFRRALQGQIANRKNRVKSEVGQLCELTYQLRMRLE